MIKRSDLEKAFREGRLIKGIESVKRALSRDELEQIIVSSNGKKAYEELKQLSIKTPVEHSELTSKEQGMICKKPFPINVLGLKKGVKK